MYSITHGEVTFDQMFSLIKDFTRKSPNDKYHISVGTDSQNFDLTKTIIVVAIHRVGKGGIFFIDEKKVKKITNVRQKLFYETNISLDLAMRLIKKFQDEGFGYEIEIHIDAGPNALLTSYSRDQCMG